MRKNYVLDTNVLLHDPRARAVLHHRCEHHLGEEEDVGAVEEPVQDSRSEPPWSAQTKVTVTGWFVQAAAQPTLFVRGRERTAVVDPSQLALLGVPMLGGWLAFAACGPRLVVRSHFSYSSGLANSLGALG